MHGDAEERRYFAYIALFVFSMLLLVQGGNLLILLVGWGLVGLSSYLLIGFHQERPSAIAAAKKAFIMNAIGDATMALALFLLIEHTGSVNFGALSAIGGSSDTVVYLVALGLLGGAVAKSAQVPLHTWLPDAMEGPTPVSALIHAATMVTAGVYLVARTHVVFELAPKALDLVAILGTVTLVMAGLIALVQTDIKRVIAYSTMSQIGYMFLGVGVGAYSNGMFHLLTHAFFKALLFLAAGIVIHALTGEQDMRRMGGLRKLSPITYWCFLAGALSLVGIPPFAGFFSKDSILAAALARGTFGAILWVFAVVGTFLTGVYTFRMLFLVFWGEPSAYAQEHFHQHHGREAPHEMFWPVAILTVLSIVGGWIQFAPFWTPISKFLEPSAPPLVDPSGTQELVSSIFAVGFGVVGHRGRVGDLRGTARRGPARAAAAAAARAQVLVRRALRRRLLQAGRVDRARLEPLDRAAADPRLRDRRRARDAAGRPRRRPPADRPAPRVRPRARRRPRRPRRRLHHGALTWMPGSSRS